MDWTCCATCDERIEQCVMRESPRQRGVPLVAGQFAHISQHFVHAAVFAVEHFLQLFVGYAGTGSAHPFGKAHEHFQRGFAAAVQVGVAQER